jgi:hypothetical protein
MFSVSCHYGMARPRVADGGDGPQIWRVAASILNNQFPTVEKGGLQLGGWERGTEDLGFGRILWNF